MKSLIWPCWPVTQRDRYITMISDIKRPGIELAGFSGRFFYPNRVQLLGMTEISFLKELDSVRLVKDIEKLLSYDLPCVIYRKRARCSGYTYRRG